MALLGNAAMLLWYDIVPEQIAEHDEWHTREHFPERVGIPGFLRAQRWVATASGPRFFVVYEVRDIDVLSDAPYLERLNHPTPWTSRMMPHFRGMVRGFCRLDHSVGTVLGSAGVTVRYSAATGAQDRLQCWLADELIPDLMQRKGITGAYVLRSDRAPEMTAEQRIRGRDASVDLVLFVTGYAEEAITGLAAKELSAISLESRGASPGSIAAVYEFACLSGTR
jgi:hypothetical protein